MTYGRSLSGDGTNICMFRNSEQGLPPDKRQSFFRISGRKSQAPPAVSTPIGFPVIRFAPKMSAISYGRNDIVAPESSNAIVVRASFSDETST